MVFPLLGIIKKNIKTFFYLKILRCNVCPGTILPDPALDHEIGHIFIALFLISSAP